MAYEIIYRKRPFGQQIKKVHKNQQEIILKEVEVLKENPFAGKQLTGILRDFRELDIPRLSGAFQLVYKVSALERRVELWAIGPHRTIFEEMERYIKMTT
jgi:mRNA-degrading endonuclease RelE of RelBE toxin-antitoxin system